MDRVPYGDRGREDRRGRCLARTESKGRPHEPRNGNEDQWIVGALLEQPEPANDHQRHEQQRRFDVLVEFPAHLRRFAPRQEHRSHEEYSGRVSEPPREPNRSVLERWGDAGQEDAGRADAGRHTACQECRGGKLEHVLRPIERAARADPSLEQERRHQGFQDVPNADREGNDDGREHARGLVGEEGHTVREEGAEQDTGPHPIPQQQDGRDRDPRRRPHRRCVRPLKGQSQAEAGAGVVEDCDDEGLDGPMGPQEPRAGFLPRQGHASARHEP